ncbi:MAG: hypothetical protein ABWW69_03325 [Pyrodictiaceae archaeon]
MNSEKRRRPLMVPIDIAEALKKVASKRGMTLASYIRALMEAIIEAERQGYYSPTLVKDALLLHKILHSGMIPIPLEILKSCNNSDEARRISASIAGILVNLGIDLKDLLRILLAPLNLIVYEKEKIIVLPTIKTYGVLSDVIKGLLEAYKPMYNIIEKDGAIIISQKDKGI